MSTVGEMSCLHPSQTLDADSDMETLTSGVARWLGRFFLHNERQKTTSSVTEQRDLYDQLYHLCDVKEKAGLGDRHGFKVKHRHYALTDNLKSCSC